MNNKVFISSVEFLQVERFYFIRGSRPGVLKLQPACQHRPTSTTNLQTDYSKKYNNTVFGYDEGGTLRAGAARVLWALAPEYGAVAVTGLGSEDAGLCPREHIHLGLENTRIAAAAGVRALRSAGILNAEVETLGDARAAAEGAHLASFIYQTNKAADKRKPEMNIQFYGNEGSNEHKAWRVGTILAESQNWARELKETPANLLTPTDFAQRASEVLEPLGVKVIARDCAWCKEKGMGSFLSVAQGSDQPPVFLELHYYNGEKGTTPVVLVGKGVTFDCGGVSIKPSANMAAMRGDMGGAACVAAAACAVAKLQLPVNLTCLIPLTENMVNGSATRPGDVYRAMNKRTVLVDNTDAEGRLILADALCYADTFNPQVTIDIATLTGAMRVALGDAATGAFCSHDDTLAALRLAAQSTGDRVWPFPLYKRYTQRVTDFPNVDVHNVGKGTGGGSCTAAAFLQQFAPARAPWVHLDIAGVMNDTEDQPYLDKGMTGRPVRTIVEFLQQFSQEKCKFSTIRTCLAFLD